MLKVIEDGGHFFLGVCEVSVLAGGYFLLGKPFLFEVDGFVDLDHVTCAFLGIHMQDVPCYHILFS